MAGVSLRRLRELTSWSVPPCVSIYLPLDPKEPGIEAARLALKDLVRDARNELETATTLRRPDIDELLAPGEALLTAERWSRGHRGYSVLAAPGHVTELRLDVDVPSVSAVGGRFVVAPLVAALPSANPFYVLAVSHDWVRLFRGDGSGLIDVAVPGLPTSRADALWYEHHERQLNVHGGSHQRVDQITGTIHGSPSDRDLHKQQLLRFFRIVDDRLRAALHDQTAPLLVAGVDYELAVYREATRYPHLAAVVSTGNPERLGAADLYEKVWPIAADVLDSARRAFIDRIAESPEPLTSIPAILAACRDGKVAALLARPDRLWWGSLDGADGHRNRLPGDIELVSAAIGAALDQGAAVYPAAPGELPGDAPVAAVARY